MVKCVDTLACKQGLQSIKFFDRKRQELDANLIKGVREINKEINKNQKAMTECDLIKGNLPLTEEIIASTSDPSVPRLSK